MRWRGRSRVASTLAMSKSKAPPRPSNTRSMRRSRWARAPTASAVSESSSPGTRSLSRIEIVALTPDQRAKLAVYGARWEALRRATARPDYAGATAWVHKAYAAAGLRPPRDIVWEQTPADLAVGWARRRA